VRINVQLIQASPEKHLWAEKFDRDMQNVLALQSDIAQANAREVKAVITPEEDRRMRSSRSVDPEAHEAYLKGRFYWNKRTGSDLQKAIEYFNEAIGKDPGYALAYAGLASTYVGLPEYAGLMPKETMPKAEAAARRALELDPTLGEAHAVLGITKAWYDWDFAGAEREFKRAIELDPGYPTAHHWYSRLLVIVGRLDEALAEIRRAQELDPLSLVISQVVGTTLKEMHRDDDAIVQIRKTLELDPNFPGAHLSLGGMYVSQGEFEEGIAELQKARMLAGSGPTGLSSLGYAYARAGRRSEAVRMLAELLEFSEQGYSVSASIAYVYCGLGDKDKAFEWLEEAYRERSSSVLFLKVNPEWDGLRLDPRFIALLKKIGLED
jgi:tetratricopeptide (TPR) repeat protein